MRTYLLVWNPNLYDSSNFEEEAERVRQGGDRHVDRWSTGTVRRITTGDRLFLVRLGSEPRGVMASGHALSSVIRGEHWNAEKRAAGAEYNYVKLRFDAVLDPSSDPPLSLEVLEAHPELMAGNWHPQSAMEIQPRFAEALERLWHVHLGGVLGGDLSDATDDPEELRQRARRLLGQGLVGPPPGNRNPPSVLAPAGRRFFRLPAVVAHVIARSCGRCELCGCSPFAREDGTPYLEVHHVRQLASGGSDMVTNAAALCANCHRQLHQGIDRDGRREALFARVPELIRE